MVKFYGWEVSFENAITKRRVDEIGILKIICFLNVAKSLTFVIAPFLV